MFQSANFASRINQTDWAFYALSALLGVTIVLVNYQPEQAQSAPASTRLDTYLERVIARMDAVSGQLNAWSAVDIRHDRNAY